MTTILAIDTATEACSVALYRQGEYREQVEIIPRQHNQRLFSMLAELLPHGRLREQGVTAIAYGAGPGSFTGLRIAASAVQGLAYANQLPCIPVSTLLCQAQRALREGLVQPGDSVFSTLDARINELYYALIGFEDELAVLRHAPRVAKPAAVELAATGDRVHGIGSGLHYLEQLPATVQARLSSLATDLLPTARDLVPLALAALRRGDTQQPEAVCPVYVRDQINWKKIPEQGKAKAKAKAHK